MKKIILQFILLIVPMFSLLAQDSLNMFLVGSWNDTTIVPVGGGDRRYNSCGGFAKDGREYALLGASEYAIFLDVTDPSNINEIGRFGDGVVTTWREMKTYKDHAYFVSDNNPNGLMVFDMSEMPDTVYQTYFSNDIVQAGHMLNIDTLNGRLYICGGSAGNGLFVFDIATNPSTPALLSYVTLPGGYVHDLHVKNNIAYCSHGNAGLYVYDYSDPAFPVLLASKVTNGYNHSSWLTKDDKYLLVCEEVPTGLPMLMMDIQDVSNGSLEIVKSFKEPLLEGIGELNNCYHNPYIKGDYAFVASYQDGVTVWDIQDPLEPALVGYYKTDNNTVYSGYSSIWGAYPYLPSGNILISDMQKGLFVIESPLNPPTVSTKENQFAPITFDVYPNPATKFITVDMGGELATGATYNIYGVDGTNLINGTVTAQSTRFTLPIQQLENGTYFVEINNGKKSFTKKIVKQN